MLCITTHSNPNLIQVKHLEILGEAQENSESCYHNDLGVPFLHTATFQLNLKMPKHSTNSTNLSNTIHTFKNHGSGCVV